MKQYPLKSSPLLVFGLCALVLALPSTLLRAQNSPSTVFQNAPSPIPQQSPAKAFFMDVLFFKGDRDSTQRVDIFTVVPYTTLSFMKKDGVYLGDYYLTITLKDATTGKDLQTIRKERPLKEDRIEATLGATAAFDNMQTSFMIAPGSYTVIAEVEDILSKRTVSMQRSFKALQVDAMQFAMSSVMLASAITPNGDRFGITPYLSDDVSPLTQDGFYVFFETYNAFGPGLDSADFVCEVLDEKNNRLTMSRRTRYNVAAPRDQHYLGIKLPPQMQLGNYTLRVLALRANDTTQKFQDRDVIAASARTIRLEWKGLGWLTMLKGEELNRAVRQMRYVAQAGEITTIQNGTNEEEKQKRFYEYWQRLDPTPKTLRNEAFEEYYQRIDYANRNFRTMGAGEGWASDMGMIYTIFGQPQYTRDVRRDGRILWSWVYPTFAREFVFVDFTGFGSDFRLSSGMPFEKYRYRR
ncbi:MAG: GWxTD domain-containing protein [Candidatus Kapaibacterium sp.]|nr:MAG: GWxTD domain-containing protein [Candidatus Kapabacteria bacterium]